MTATYTSFVTAITGMTVTGVNRKYTSPPLSVNTADLPCSFPMLPSGTETTLVFGNGATVGGNQPAINCDLIFAYEPVGQGTNPQNFSGLLTLVDAVVTASKALTRPTAGPMSFELRLGTVLISGNEYWAVIESWSGVG